MRYHGKKVWLLLFFICHLIFPASFVFSQQTRLNFKKLTLEEGLSQNSVLCILQDSRGFLWFGTADGLNKYDGYNFTIYKKDPSNPASISENYILSLYEDSAGILWIGTEGGGLNRFDRGTGEFASFKHNPEKTNSLTGDNIHTITEDSKGDLWIGTDTGLNKLNITQMTFTGYRNHPEINNTISDNRIRSIVEDKDGILWIATLKGLNKLNPDGNSFTRFERNTGFKDLCNDSIRAMILDNQNNLWLGTDNGLICFNREKEFICFKHSKNDPSSISHSKITAICKTKQNHIWVGTEAGGLNRVDLSLQKFSPITSQSDDQASLSNAMIYSINEDKGGILWVGVRNHGLYFFDYQSNKFGLIQASSNQSNSLSNNSVWAINSHKENIFWFGTRRGLNKYNRATNTFTNFLHDPSLQDTISHNHIRSIAHDNAGSLWIGTEGGGVNRFDLKTEKFKRFVHNPRDPSSLSHNSIRGIYIDHQNDIWIGTFGGGLDRYDKESGGFIHFRHDPADTTSISHDFVYSLSEDRAGNIWVGTRGGGLNKWIRDKKSFIRFKNDPDNLQSISHNIIYCLFFDRKNNLWIGTRGGGLNRFNSQDGTFTRFTEWDGLPNNTVYGILEDSQGRLWLSTNNGLSAFDPEKNTFENYGYSDGLQSNEFNGGAYYKYSEKELLFGGINGINIFNPGTIKTNFYIPPIVITGFQIANKPVPIGKLPNGRTILSKVIGESSRINLSYRDKILTFEFAALHFGSPGKNQYAYRLEGFESDWNRIGTRRYASYTNLPHGEYKLHVKGTNNDGIWNESGTTLKIIINPPFWKTWWFYTFCAIFISGSLVAFYKLRVRQLQNRKKELESLVNQRTNELQSVNKELEKLSIVASETDNGVVIMDPEGNIEWINEGFTRMYEHTLEQLVQEKGRNLIDISGNRDIMKYFNQSIREKKTIIYESLTKTRSGKERWAQSTLTPILGDKGEVIKLIAIDSDISKVKEAESQAEQAREMAEEAKKVADRANQAKSEFLARMSHEIRTPMNGVIGFADMLMDTSMNEEQLDYVRTISRSGEALITILNDILDFSKIEAGELTFDPIDFDPELTVFDVCDIITPRLGDRQIEVICRIGDNVPAFIKTDAGRFRQVIVNLMGNAAKFTEAGEIELSIEVAEEKENRLKLLVKVRDTGVGISEDKWDTIFNVFQQADGSTTRKYGGTGLGLSICRQIARLMEGDVWVKSKVGTGSTFHFSCWVERSQRKVKKDLSTLFLKNKLALILDDNSNNLEILTHLLTQSGMKVLAVDDPFQVIKIIEDSYQKQNPVDIGIIDINMPGMSGFEVAKKIRSHQGEMSDIPLLAFSSSTLSRSKKYRESGFSGFLPKPIRRQKLIKVITSVLSAGKAEEGEEREQIITRFTVNEEAKHSIHILLAEDNPINLKLARFMLEKAGYELTVAQDGEEAVELFLANSESIDMIMMDIQMPKMDGRQATKVIREKGFTDVPIIALTAESMQGDRERCLEVGMSDYISKPIKRNQVYSMIKKWVLKSKIEK